MPDIAFSPDAAPYNAFAPDFLERFSRQDEPASAAEADLDGPWEVRHSAAPAPRQLFSVWRRGARAVRGEQASGEFDEATTAILACALRPLLGRDPLYTLGSERGREGFPLLRAGQPAGWIQLFEEQWIFGLNLLERFVRSPAALAMLLEAAGPLALERAGRLLHDRVDTEMAGVAEPVQ